MELEQSLAPLGETMTNQYPGQYPPPQRQWANAEEPQDAKLSLWQRFKSWPLIAKVGTIGCGGLVALFALLLVLGLIVQAVDPDGMDEIRADQEQERLDQEAEEAAEAEAEKEAEREEAEAAAEEAEREAEEEAERQADEEAAAEREAEEERQREEEEAAEAAEEEERQAEEEAAAEREAEEEAEQETAPSADDLGQRVEEAALSAAAVSSFTEMPTSPVVAVTEIEDMGASTIRVYVQESLTDPARDDVARWFFNMTCMDVPDVDTIVVRDVSGLDSNHYARDLSNMPACQ